MKKKKKLSFIYIFFNSFESSRSQLKSYNLLQKILRLMRSMLLSVNSNVITTYETTYVD